MSCNPGVPAAEAPEVLVACPHPRTSSMLGHCNRGGADVPGRTARTEEVRADCHASAVWNYPGNEGLEDKVSC